VAPEYRHQNTQGRREKGSMSLRKVSNKTKRQREGKKGEEGERETKVLRIRL